MQRVVYTVVLSLYIALIEELDELECFFYVSLCMFDLFCRNGSLLEKCIEDVQLTNLDGLIMLYNMRQCDCVSDSVVAIIGQCN